jgi:hypothetical protein
VTDPEGCSEDHDCGGGGDESPGNVGIASAKIFLLRRANVFGARKLQIRKFVGDRHWRLRLHGRLGVGRERALLRDGAGRRVPDFVGVDLGLAQAGEIVGDGLFVVETEVLGVSANESFIEDAAGQLVEVFFFDGLQHARADFGDVGNVIERDAFGLACFAEFVAELAHGVSGS